MKNRLFVIFYTTIFAIFIAAGSLCVFSAVRIVSVSAQVNRIKPQTERMRSLQSGVNEQKRAHEKMSGEINDLQARSKDLQTGTADLEKKTQELYQSRQPVKKPGYPTPTTTPSGSKTVYLTFDDGPCNLTPQFLDVLKENGVHATFFVIGSAADYPQVIKREYAEGNVVGIHSWTHDYKIIYASTQNFFDDFNRMRNLITSLTGVSPTVCRYPGGTNNTVSLRYSDHIMRIVDPQVKAMGIHPFDWNAYAGDADNGAKPSPEKIVQNVMSSAGGNNVVVLMHDRADNRNDILALPQIINEFRARGYSFGTLSNTTDAVQFRPC